jgi:UDP-galactopyranose mutase
MDMLVVGCGLSGSVVARHFAEKGKKVVIWEKRGHIGGNMFDYVDEYGILVHKYGPHTFHTNDRELYDYIRRFGKWKDFRLTCGAVMDGKCTPTPFNFQTIDDFYPPEDAGALKKRLKEAFGDRQTATVVEVLEHPDPLVNGYARFLFEKDYKLYTAKQWGMSADEIDPSVLKRVPLRFSYDVGYFDDVYQVMPEGSYFNFFENLLDHPNIAVELNKDALVHLSVSDDGESLLLDGVKTGIPVVYTGALDELFGLSEGALPYRSLRFEWRHEDSESFQDMPVVAYPQAEGYTRITEYRKLPVQDVRGTTYAVEYPLVYSQGVGNEPYYPVLTERSNMQYNVYRSRADSVKNLWYLGRLADFKYYNMDEALRRALDICRKLGDHCM